MIQGVGASPGIAIGSCFVLPSWEWDLPEGRIKAEDQASEFERLYEGIRTSRVEIQQMKEELFEVVGSDESSIFDAHLAILEDPIFMSEIQGIIERQYKAAEVAVKEAMDHFVAMFDLLDDEYMKERALDIKDVGNRLLKHLLGVPDVKLPKDTQPFILVASELSPSQLAHLNPDHVLGIVLLGGSSNSHAAIMARALGIPLVTALENKLGEPIKTGDMLLFDGTNGITYHHPSDTILRKYTGKQRYQREEQRRLKGIAHLKATTPDGKKLELSANISSIKELEIALSSGAHGVGLFRTEFLYMDRNRLPKESEQFEVYRQVVEKLGSKPLIIRTLDIGGDKQLDYFPLPEEDNPFMGYRAIRISLDRQDLFKTQLRAILRASHYGNVKVMYPLISSVEELRAANEVLEQAKRELDVEKIPFNRSIETGIMIELPAAAMIADILAEEVDFFSIGTNDLVQFTLAVDRMNEQIGHLYEPFHPAVLRLIRMTVEAARKRGIHVGVCGELAGDVRALPLWLALDVEEVSMSSGSILKVKQRLLRTNQQESKHLMDDIWKCRTSAEIQRLLEHFLISMDEQIRDAAVIGDQ